MEINAKLKSNQNENYAGVASAGAAASAAAFVSTTRFMDCGDVVDGM